MKNKMIVFATAIFMLVLFGGCSIQAQSADAGETTEKDMQQYARIEVYSAGDRTLLCEIEDQTVLAEFNQHIAFSEDISDDDMEGIKKKLEEHEPQYIITFYKTPAAINNDGTLEKISEITTYKDTNMIMVQVSPGTIKSFSLPSEYLTFYYEASDEAISFLTSLISKNGGVMGTAFAQAPALENKPSATQQYHIGNPRIAKVEIYSGDELIKTIDEQEKCDEFHEYSPGSEKHYKKEEFADALANLEIEYRFVAYQTSASVFADAEYVALFELTVYQNSEIMKMHTPQEAVPLPFILLSEEDRTWVYEAGDGMLDYLYSLVSA